MDQAVALHRVVALVGRYPVLAGADLQVGAGEVVLLRGANGAGKTSLLRLCAGLLPVSAGRAEVLGEDLSLDRRSVRRRIGLLGHATALYDDLSALDNLRFFARAGGADPGAAEVALARVGMAGRLGERPVGRLSAGQRRRTALALLVARSPELWLLDEPHAGLDPEGRELLDSLVRQAAGAGATVLIASHESGPVEALAARTVWMSGGRTSESALVA